MVAHQVYQSFLLSQISADSTLFMRVCFFLNLFYLIIAAISLPYLFVMFLISCFHHRRMTIVYNTYKNKQKKKVLQRIQDESNEDDLNFDFSQNFKKNIQ
jgi:hypothetical protein